MKKAKRSTTDTTSISGPGEKEGNTDSPWILLVIGALRGGINFRLDDEGTIVADGNDLHALKLWDSWTAREPWICITNCLSFRNF
jgi:hypothetical protein